MMSTTFVAVKRGMMIWRESPTDGEDSLRNKRLPNTDLGVVDWNNWSRVWVPPKEGTRDRRDENPKLCYQYC